MANYKLREHESFKCKIIQVAKKDNRLAITYGCVNGQSEKTRTYFTRDTWFAMKAQDFVGPPWDHELGIDPKQPFLSYKKRVPKDSF